MFVAVNVAYSKQAVQSSIAVSDQHVMNPACAAVNGNPGQALCTSGSQRSIVCQGRPDRNCIVTAEEDYEPFWMVDLGQVYTLNAVIVYHLKALRSHELADGDYTHVYHYYFTMG